MTERTGQYGQIAEVKGGRVDKGIRKLGLPAIFSSFVAPRHSNSQEHLIQSKIKNVKSDTGLNLQRQSASSLSFLFLMKEESYDWLSH